MIPTDQDLDGDGIITGAEKLVFWSVITLVTAITTAIMAGALQISPGYFTRTNFERDQGSSS